MVNSTQITPVRPEKMADYDRTLTGTVVDCLGATQQPNRAKLSPGCTHAPKASPMHNIDAIAVRLADEGVPLRAIARATNTPSDQLRAKLHEARDEGRLLDLPKEDWPPGFPRDQRALQLSRRVTQDPEAVSLAMQQIFHLTATEVSLLMALIQNASVPKARWAAHMAHKTVDVHIHNIRRHLNAFGVAIETIWGYGYKLSDPHRRKVMDMILSRVQSAPA